VKRHRGKPRNYDKSSATAEVADRGLAGTEIFCGCVFSVVDLMDVGFLLFFVDASREPGPPLVAAVELTFC